MATQQEISDFIGISTKQIRNLQKAGILPPKQADGTFDAPKTVRAYIEYRVKLQRPEVAEISEIRSKFEKSENEGFNIDEEKNHEVLEMELIRQKIKKLEMENAKAEGKLVESSKVEKLWARLIVNSRTRLLAVPVKVAADVVGMDERAVIEDIIKGYIHEALEELEEYSIDEYTDSGAAELETAKANVSE